jgi:hypothetical protein
MSLAYASGSDPIPPSDCVTRGGGPKAVPIKQLTNLAPWFVCT